MRSKQNKNPQQQQHAHTTSPIIKLSCRDILYIYIHIVRPIILSWIQHHIESSLYYIPSIKFHPHRNYEISFFYRYVIGAGRFSSSTKGMYQNDWINQTTRFFSPKWYNDLSADAADFGMLENDGGWGEITFFCFLIKKVLYHKKGESKNCPADW